MSKVEIDYKEQNNLSASTIVKGKALQPGDTILLCVSGSFLEYEVYPCWRSNVYHAVAVNVETKRLEPIYADNEYRRLAKYIKQTINPVHLVPGEIVCVIPSDKDANPDDLELEPGRLICIYLYTKKYPDVQVNTYYFRDLESDTNIGLTGYDISKIYKLTLESTQLSVRYQPEIV